MSKAQEEQAATPEVPHDMKSTPVTQGETIDREFFRKHGLTIANWARSKGFSPGLVYAVLSGDRKCMRGKSHQIAKELRMK